MSAQEFTADLHEQIRILQDEVRHLQNETRTKSIVDIKKSNAEYQRAQELWAKEPEWKRATVWVLDWFFLFIGGDGYNYLALLTSVITYFVIGGIFGRMGALVSLVVALCTRLYLK